MVDFIYRIYTSQKTALKKAVGNFNSMCILDNNAQTELQWWEHNIKTFNIIDQNVLLNIEIFSDACLTGWCATYNGHSTGRHWSVEESKSHVNMHKNAVGLSRHRKSIKNKRFTSRHYRSTPPVVERWHQTDL